MDLASLLSGSDYGAIGGDGTTEIIGQDDLDLLMGEDLDQFSGDFDALLGAAARSPAAAMQRARAIDPRAAAVIQRRLNTRRKFPMGLPLLTIGANATNTINTQPQFLFRPERLIIPSDIAFDLRITDVRVGTQSQFASTDPIPAAVFSEVSVNTAISFKTAEVGNLVSFSALNVTADPVQFTGALIGTSATAG
jgi:hypothetical protein